MVISMTSNVFAASCEFDDAKYFDNLMRTKLMSPFQQLYTATYTVDIQNNGTDFKVADSLACNLQGSSLENCSKKLTPVDFLQEKEGRVITLTSVRGEFISKYKLNTKTQEITGFISNSRAGINITLRDCKPL